MILNETVYWLIFRWTLEMKNEFFFIFIIKLSLQPDLMG
jgi:hypothetical protein